MPRLKRLKFRELADRGYQAWERDKPEVISIDSETEGFWFYDRPFCFTVSWEGESHYFEWWDGGTEFTEPDTQIFAPLYDMVHNTQSYVFHNAKYDIQKMILTGLAKREDFEAWRIEDTEALAHLLDENRQKSLKYLARTILGEDTDEEEKLKRVRKKLGLKKEDGYHKLPRDVIYPYALKDSEFTYRLYSRLKPLLDESSELSRLYRTEMELTLTLLDMEAAGFRVDLPYVEKTSKEYADRILRVERRISQIAGKPVGKAPRVKDKELWFNPASPQQVKALFNDRGIHLESTSKDVLRTVDDILARSITEYRILNKIRSTYLLPMLFEQRDGILHPSFRQHGTRTGRMSSGGYSE